MTRWGPASGPDTARQRAEMLARIREFFASLDVLAVDTPALDQAAASDPQIESLEVRSVISESPLYLHTSPEFAMKRLLAAGYPDIYSICRVFRDGEAGRRHQPEFTMLEWYRHGFSLRQIVDETIALIHAALQTAGARPLPVEVLEYRQVLDSTTGVDTATASIAELADCAGADSDLLRSLSDRRDDWLDLLLSTRVIPNFASDRLTVLRHYPASQAALARLCPNDPAVADRFEVFCGAHELANGYVELADADEQQRRQKADQQRRAAMGRQRRATDERLLEALRHGLPPCAGVAVGVERLHMLLAGSDDIRDVITFQFAEQPVD